MTNRHIVDQLADVRAQKRVLEEHETELKAAVSKMMGDDDSLGGDDFIALQKLSVRAGGVDAAKLKAAGIDVDKFRKPDITVMSIVVERREA